MFSAKAIQTQSSAVKVTTFDLEGDTETKICHFSGDGNDIVYGFNTNSTLQIGDGTGTFSTTKSGSDIIVTVDAGLITLKDTASLSAVNIKGKENFNPSWSLNSTIATYGTPSETLFTLSSVNNTTEVTVNTSKKTVT